MTRISLVLLVSACLGLPVQAENSAHTFGLYIAGIKAGTIQIKSKEAGSAYSLAGAVQPTSFLRKLRDVGYTGSAAGSSKSGSYRPTRYQGETKTGSRTSRVKMRFSGGRPKVDSYLPKREKRPYDIDPSRQKGTVDVLTSAFEVFRDQPKVTLCGKTIHMFDGRRRSKLVLAKPKFSGSGATCAGTYVRVAGFSAEDMKERVNFPFSLTYNALDDTTYRLMSFSTKTTFGSAKAVRK